MTVFRDAHADCGRSLWSRSPVSVDFGVRQDEQGAEELGGSGVVGAELGQYAPVLEVREATLDRCPSNGEDAVGFLLAWCELVGVEAGDDNGVA